MDISCPRLGVTSTGPCASVLALVFVAEAVAAGTGFRALASDVESWRTVAVLGATYSTCTVRLFASLCCLRMSLASSPPMLAVPTCLGTATDDLSAVPLLDGSLTEELRPSDVSSPSCKTGVESLFTRLPIKPTTLVYSLSQLWRATSNRSALRRGSGTSIRRSRSRACGVTYSGNVSGVLTMYLYSRLMLSPSGFAGSSSKGRYPASIAYCIWSA